MNNQKTCGDGNADNCPGCWQCDGEMADTRSERLFNGRVAGYQYQLRIKIDPWNVKIGTAEMTVFETYGGITDQFTREFHCQYDCAYIKKAMRQWAIDRETIEGLETEIPQ